MKRADLDKRAQRDKFGSGKHGFQSGNPSGGVLPTIPGAEWFDHVQEEIANVIEAANLRVNPQQYNQLLTAIKNLSTSAVVNNLTSSNTDKPLSALQGKVLAEQIAAAVSGSLNLRGALGDTLNLNDLTAPNHVGVWHQSANAYAVPERNYPVKLAGTLLVLPAVGGGTQIYIQYSGYVIWLRTQTSGTSGWGEWRRLGDDKLGNSGNQTISNGALTVGDPAVWNKLVFPVKNGGSWMIETNPNAALDTDGSVRIYFKFVDGGGSRYISFPHVGGNEQVAYQNWVQAALAAQSSLKTIDYNGDQSDRYANTAFYRGNGQLIDGKATPKMEIHITHPTAAGNAYARGIGFDYGGGWGLSTTSWDSNGNYLGQRIVLTEDNGVMLTGDQTIAGTKTFSGSLKTASTITSGGDIVISNSNKTARFGMGASDCFIHNPTAQKYLQLKDNGELAYSDDKIILQSMLSNTVSSTSTTTVANSAAVKTAYDKAVAALNAANANAVTGSMASTGYVRLPNGLILQWGVGDSAEDTGKINFPIAFPVALYMVNLSETHGGYSGNFYQPSWVRGDSTTAAFAYRSTGGIGLFSWFAIGR